MNGAVDFARSVPIEHEMARRAYHLKKQSKDLVGACPAVVEQIASLSRRPRRFGSAAAVQKAVTSSLWFSISTVAISLMPLRRWPANGRGENDPARKRWLAWQSESASAESRKNGNAARAKQRPSRPCGYGTKERAYGTPPRRPI